MWTNNSRGLYRQRYSVTILRMSTRISRARVSVHNLSGSVPLAAPRYRPTLLYLHVYRLISRAAASKTKKIRRQVAGSQQLAANIPSQATLTHARHLSPETREVLRSATNEWQRTHASVLIRMLCILSRHAIAHTQHHFPSEIYSSGRTCAHADNSVWIVFIVHLSSRIIPRYLPMTNFFNCSIWIAYIALLDVMVLYTYASERVEII